jgi:DNA-binding NtrC family response regulator
MTTTTDPIGLVEDDPIMGESLVERLEYEGYTVHWLRTAAEGLAAARQNPFALMILDYRLPDMDGAALYHQLREDLGRGTPAAIVITGHGTIDNAVDLLKAGVEDYLTKPVDVNAFIERVQQLMRTVPPMSTDQPRLGVSAAMRRLERQIQQVAAHEETCVLIQGESGAGKEEVARRLHAAQTAYGPFVAINCAAIPETLIESELFGHEKGAFTGANTRRIGHFEAADGGTLFLDEIGDMPLQTQVKLLRVLQERGFQRLGSTQLTPLNARVVCATHRDLGAMVSADEFREDLYYRINVIPLQVPPLQERPEDILWLAERFIEELREDLERPEISLSRAAREQLLDHPWAGNVRELRHALRRAVVFLEGEQISPEDLPLKSSNSDDNTQRQLKDYLEERESAFIQARLTEHDGAMGATAQSLGISRKALWEKMKRLGMRTSG